MKWINNYAWFERKAAYFVTPFLLGIIVEQNAPDYATWIVIPMMAVFGWARDTKSANDVWCRGNRGVDND